MLVIPGVNTPSRLRSWNVPLPALEPAGMGAAAAVDDGGPKLIGPSGMVGTPIAEEGRALRQPLPPVIQPPSSPRPAPSGPSATPAAAPAAPRRPTSLFTRILPAPLTSGRGDSRAGSAITVEPSTDPAAEAALKRRIERQIHESLGDRVHDVEVRIRDRDVTIRAKATRFWQRRTVRRTLESLPGLAGYRPTIEMLD
jgi:hypothetical protein